MPLEMTPARELMVQAIERCFDECQGLGRYSTEESDRYWELAEFLMVTHGASIGSPLLRKDAP